MTKSLSFSLFSFLMFVGAASVKSAPALSSSICQLRGELIDISQRKVSQGPKEWRESWGLSEFREYTDIALKIIEVKKYDESSPATDCSLDYFQKNFQGKKFQIEPSEKKHRFLKKGTCLVAKTQFSGDEFAIGQWIWDIKECPKNS